MGLEVGDIVFISANYPRVFQVGRIDARGSLYPLVGSRVEFNNWQQVTGTQFYTCPPYKLKSAVLMDKYGFVTITGNSRADEHYAIYLKQKVI
jgi:hypothetical protein